MIELKVAPYLKPGAYLVNSVNPIGVPFILFVRFDPASQSAWLQVSPEPLAPNGVLWTVPTGKAFSETFTFTTETAQMAGLLNGLIYYQTSTTNTLTAVNMHNGEKKWDVQLNGPSPDFITSPVISTPFSAIPREYVYVVTLDNGFVVLSEIACCSGNGICAYNMGNSVCQCNPNYFGLNCDVFCDTNTCGGPGNVGGNCSVNGCTCNPGYAGTSCDYNLNSNITRYCNPVTTCGNKGTCSPQGICLCTGKGFDFNIYSGANCEITQMNWFLVGCFIGAALVIILIIVIIILACTKKSGKRGKKHRYEKVLTNPTE
jgi:hypothetical protein